jgi:hypothetical protein
LQNNSNDPKGLFTSDELARIQDAVNTWDALLAPYNVTISLVTDPTQANMVIDIGTTSACGGMTNGVLVCYVAIETPHRAPGSSREWSVVSGIREHALRRRRCTKKTRFRTKKRADPSENGAS